MIVQNIYEVGDTVRVNSFCFRNRYGGIGMSKHGDAPYSGDSVVEVLTAWLDKEVGYKYHGKPLNQELINYLEANHAIGLNISGRWVDDLRDADRRFLKESVGPLVIFFGEFDV